MPSNRTAMTAALICATVTALLTVTGCGGKDGGPGKADAEPTARVTPIASAAPTTTAPPKDPFDGMPASQVYLTASSTMRSLTSVVMNLSGTQDGKKVRAKSAMDGVTGDCVSHVQLGAANYEVIRVGKTTYFKGDTAFWVSQVGAAKGSLTAAELKGRWVRQPAGTDGDLDDLCDLGTHVMDLTNGSGADETKGAPTTVGGISALPVTGPDPAQDDGSKVTLYIAGDGLPYVLRAVRSGSGKDMDDETLTDFNKPVRAVAPPASQTVDLKGLAS